MSQQIGMKDIFTRSKLTALLTLGLTEFVRGSLLFFILPIYIRGVLQFPPSVVGYAMAAHYALDTSLRGPSGWLTDRFGQRKVAVSALCMGWVGLLLIARFRFDWSIILGSALLGIGMAAIWPAVVSRVTGDLPPEANATAMSGVMMSWLLGVGSGTVAMSFTLGRNVQSGFITLLVIWLCATFLASLSLQPYRTEDHHRKRLGFRNIVSQIYSVRLLLPGIFVQTFIMGIVMPVFVLYTQYVLNVSGQTYSTLLVAGGATTVLLQLPVGRLVDRFGYKPFLMAGFGACAVLLVSLVRATSLPLLFLGIIGVGASYALILPSWNSILAKSINARQRAVMWGVFMTFEGLGMATGPLVGSWLWEQFRPSTPFFFAGLVLVVMMTFYGLVPIERGFVPQKQHESADGQG
ncbi:MFS transporter [Alicyclobacillus curvatus]|nr:MFS transporter [Alicyclobacillus curvatus]